MIYFDNAATSFPKPPEVAQAMSRFLAEDAANPGRAGHRMAVAAERMLDDVRLKLTRLFDGEDHHRMVFAMNCTDALNMAIKGVMSELLRNDDKPHVITTVLEHNSVSRPLQAMATQGLIELTRVTCDEDGFVDPDDIRKAITPHTAMIVVTHASNVLGTIQDAGAIGKIAREHDVLFCLDAAQTAGILPISIQQMQVDLLAFPGHKSLLGPTGIGGLYVGARCPEPAEAVAATHEAGDLNVTLTRQSKRRGRLNPWREGGTGGDSGSPTQPVLFPYYLEGGTPNTVGIAGLQAALDYVAGHSMADRLAHEQALCAKIRDRFADDARFTWYGTRDIARRVSAVSINVGDIPADVVGGILDSDFDIAVRPGMHCSPYIHRRLGTDPAGTVRISPGDFNTEAELDRVLDALDQIAG